MMSDSLNIRGVHVIIHDCDATRAFIVIYCNPLMRFHVEEWLALLPHSCKVYKCMACAKCVVAESIYAVRAHPAPNTLDLHSKRSPSLWMER